MQDEYIVVPDWTAAPAAPPRRRGPPGRLGPGVARAPAAPTAAVRVERMARTEAAARLQGGGAAAVGRRMRTSLIRPMGSGLRADAVPGDCWAIAAVGADEPEAGAPARTGAGVKVAVLDTGIDRDHPAFEGVAITEEDFTGEGRGDLNGHGTHCAGTLLGRDVDGRRIGVARGVGELLVGKVLDKDGGGTSDMLIRGIEWALDRGAQVVSMSIGFDFPGWAAELEKTRSLPTALATSMALEDYRQNLRVFDALMQLMRAKAEATGGAVIVAAAGNESLRRTNPEWCIGASLPAAASGVVSVGALRRGADSALGVADFSNINVRVAAPGTDILSARPGGGLALDSGTSMACPVVAGVACLWWAHLQASAGPGERVGADQVIENLLAHAQPLPHLSAVDVGRGLVRAP